MFSKKELTSKGMSYPREYKALDTLYRHLATLEQQYLSDDEAESFEVRFSGFDISTGQTSKGTGSFFLPNPGEEYNVSGAQIEYDEFAHHRGEKETLGRLDSLTNTYMEYGAALAQKFQPPSKSILFAGPMSDRRMIIRGVEYTKIEAAQQFAEPRTSHRVLVTYSTNRMEDRVTVSELEIMVSWVLGGMGAQTYAYWRKNLRASDLHMTFPVGGVPNMPSVSLLLFS
ncbi:hypothetical protein BO94DRAFT_582017 [Aspergillus sclerotioniger CBS 115572]|uniref:Uncharacterized protein n=1 Tax=Aspergillus sclerotioniger CBS 115572 TaxID=1450535 RepID=A0A317XCE2_9EURO|nr:hypothetical protein BO94DRAFT_582017 [Aspergillus sclerotioniger CBS 115572]PWY94628.1 hypothetical protein BO94DRAFT_582017 [Aspergillus sclerotioniger CBS 115572]